MKNKLPEIGIYDINNKFIKKLDINWIEKNNSKLLNFAQFYKNDNDDSKEPCLRISPYSSVVILRNFSLAELNVKGDIVENSLVRKTKNYDVVGLGHIKFLDKNKCLFYGENPNENHLREIFGGCEIYENDLYGEKSFIVNLD